MRATPRVRPLPALVLAALLGLLPSPSPAQVLTIPEYRELLISKESVLTRLERELAVANSRLDRLVAEKQAAGSPRGERSRELSAEIVKASQDIAELERQRRAALADQRSLRAALNERLTREIEANLDRLGAMPQEDPGYGDLLIETGRYVETRDSLRLQIRIEESLEGFREFPILATDGPSEIREKAGFYRDYVHDVDQKIAAIDREIAQIRERDRVAARMQELQEDLAFQDEDVPGRPGTTAGDIREDPAVEGSPDAPGLLGARPDRRIANLEEEKRQLELRRDEFEAKVRGYEARARTIYSRTDTQAEEESR